MRNQTPKAHLSPRITGILWVRDTREFEEIADGIWAPVPDSGTPHECDRCGKTHLIHICVRLEDGTTAILGSGCAQGESAAAKGLLVQGAKAATRIAALERRISKLQRVADLYQEAVWQVNNTPKPEVVKIEGVQGKPDMLTMGGSRVYLPAGSNMGERRAALVGSWVTERMIEILETLPEASKLDIARMGRNYIFHYFSGAADEVKVAEREMEKARAGLV